MDRSTSSLSGSGKSKDSSLSASRVLADLESKTSALGHVGFLKWQRNELNKKYLEQRELNEVEKRNAAASRKLALRLAAQIAVKEAKLKSHSEALANAHGSNYVAARKQDAVLKDLEGKLQDDLTRASALLRTLGGPESLSRHDGAGFHLSRPLSPPLSPFHGKEPFSRRHRSPSAQKLPSEILGICQMRAETLLRDCNDQQDSLHQLQQTEASLRWTIHERTNEISRLQNAKDEVETQLAQAKNDIRRFEADAKTGQNLIARLMTEKSELLSHIKKLNQQVATLTDARNETADELAKTCRDLVNLKQEAEQTVSKLASTEANLCSLTEAQEASCREAEKFRVEAKRRELASIAASKGLEREIEALQAEITSLRISLDEHKTTATQAHDERGRLADAITVSEKEMERLRADRAQSDHDHAAQHAELKGQISTLEANISALEGEGQKVKEVEASLRTQLKKAETAYASAMIETTRLKEQHTEALAASEARAADSLRHLRDSQDKISLLDTQSEGQAQVADVLKKEIEQLTYGRDQAAREVEFLHLQQAEAKHDATAWIDHLESEVDAQKALLEQHEQTITDHARTIGSLRDQVSAHETKQAKIANEVTVLERQGAESEKAYTAKLTDLNAKLDELNEKCAALDLDKKSLLECEASLCQTLGNLESTKEDLQEELSSARALHEQEQQAAHERAAELEREILKLHLDINSMEKNRRLQDTITTTLQSRIHDLEAAAHAGEQKLSEIQAKLHNTEQSLRTRQEALTAEKHKMQLLEITGAELRAKVVNHEKRASISTNVINSLRAQLATAQSTIDALEEGKARVDEELLQSKSQLTAAHSSERKLQAQIVDLERTIQDQQTSAVALQYQLEDARNAESSSSTTISGLSTQLDGVNEKLLQTRSQYTKCSMKLAESEKIRKEADLELAQVKKSHTEAIETLETEQKRAQALDGHLGEERKTTESVRQLLAGLQQNLDTSKNEHSKLQTSRLALEADLQESRTQKDGLAAKLNDELARCESLMEQLQTTSSSQSSLEKELGSLRAQSQHADGEMSRLRQALAEALDSSQMYDLSSKAADSKVEALTGQLSTLEAKINNLQSLEQANLVKSVANQSAISKLEAELTQAQTVETRLQTDLNGALERVKGLEISKVNIESELRTSREDIQALREINQTLEKELASARRQSRDLEQKQAQYQEDARSAQNAHAELQSSNAQLIGDLARRTEAVERSNAEVQSARKRIEDLERKHTELQDVVRTAQNSNVEHEATKEQNAKELAKRYEQLSQSERHIVEARARFQDLEQKHAQLKDEARAAQKLNAELGIAKERLVLELDQSNSKLQSSQEEKATLAARLQTSEQAIESLHSELKQLATHNHDAQAQLRKSQAIRVSHEHALGSIRVRLGASKMAKRGVQVQLSQTEKELNALRMQKERLEDSLSNALADVAEGRTLRAEQKQAIVELQARNDRMAQRLNTADDHAQHLRDTIRQIELESDDYKHEMTRLKQVVDQALAEVASLKSQISELTDQRTKDQEELKARRRSIEDVQQAKASLEEALTEKTALLEKQQGLNLHLEQQAAADKESIQRLDEEKSELVEKSESLQRELNTHPAILGQRTQIERLERELAQAQHSAERLKSRLQEQEKRNEYLQQQHEQYEREVPILRRQVSEATSPKAQAERRAQIQDRPSENIRPDRRSHSSEEISTYASSPTLVMHEVEPPIEEDDREEYFDVRPSSVRPMSRRGTGRSSLKAFRILGAEAAQGRLGQDADDDVKKQLWEKWTHQQKLSSLNEAEEKDPLGEDEQQRPKTASALTAPKLRRKLTKRKKVEELKAGEQEPGQGKGKFYNLMHYGSVSRPNFERVATPGPIGRSFSSRQ